MAKNRKNINEAPIDYEGPERMDDVEETEKMILRKIQKGENVKGLVS